MNNRLFHEVASDSLKEEVLTNSALSLVKELNHAYGLKVYGKSTNNGYHGFVMCNDEGFPIAKVFVHDDAYCYHAPYQQKSRGSDEFDRQTYRSKKLSTLMTTLKKANIVTTTDRVLAYNKRRLNNLVDKVSYSFEDESKDSLPSAYAHKLLQAMVEGKGMDSFSQSDRDLYLHILDKYKNVDTMKDVKKQGIESMFKDCYLVIGDSNGQYIVSESSYEYNSSGYTGGAVKLQIKPTKPFKRVKDLSEFPSVLTALTMLKVNLGDDFRPYSSDSNGLFPLGDKHISDLDVVYGYERRYGDFDMGFLCLSK
jgi:hypothetical protein